MSIEFSKTYSITLKFSYEDGATITEYDDPLAKQLRALIKKMIADKVGHVQMGKLSAHIVGDVTEA